MSEQIAGNNYLYRQYKQILAVREVTAGAVWQREALNKWKPEEHRPHNRNILNGYEIEVPAFRNFLVIKIRSGSIGPDGSVPNCYGILQIP